ncbi:MAG TPA: dihydroneopterin aldolase [Polyangiaceae bacterium]|nr:dihydroneopterin aldolase [Polyangiaceae bacterium]
MAATSAREVVGYALRLRGIRVQGHLGVSDAERERLQELVVAVELELAGEQYPPTDEIERAVDYAAIVRIVEESVQERHFRLLETFALGVARRLGDRWPAAVRVRVAATKAIVPVSPVTDEAAVEITLGRALELPHSVARQSQATPS